MLINQPHTIHLPNGFSFDMMPVPKGRVMMGSEQYEDEKPIHEILFDYDFLMARFPVTQALWEAIWPGSNPSYFQGAKRPVEMVSWYDAAVFCNQLSLLCDKDPVYFQDAAFRRPFGQTSKGFNLPESNQDFDVLRNPNARGFRLPTEAEWEYTARGGPSSMPFTFSGGQVLDELGWYGENSHYETHPVGLKLSNTLGLYDMSGNVCEWCEDQWHNDYEGAPRDGSAWLGHEKGGFRVLRGGGWFHSAPFCRVAYRGDHWPANRYCGFRLVLASPLPV